MEKDKLRQLLSSGEFEPVEYKAWRNSIPLDGENKFENRRCLLGYCVAICNAGGGHIIAGVSDSGVVVGTNAQLNFNTVKKKVLDSLGIRINISQIEHESHRVIVFTVPPRPIGTMLKFAGVPLVRIGESLEMMTDDEQRRILMEGNEDFSARICDGFSSADIDQDAMKKLRDLYAERQPSNQDIVVASDERFLSDLALMRNGKFTNACAILLARQSYLDGALPNAEISFEYRNDPNSIAYNERQDYREPLVLVVFKVWEKIFSRQQVHVIIDGLFRREIPAFNMEVIREALLNAVCHRDYSQQGQVFIKQSPESIQITNPGGFLSGITPDNIIYATSNPRNRLLAEIFQKVFAGVERSGQGADRIFRTTIEEGKGMPSYHASTQNWVSLNVPAILQDGKFIEFLEKISQERQSLIPLSDVILLENIRRGNGRGLTMKDVGHLVKSGFLEAHGKTRGAQYVLAKRYYSSLGKLGERTRIIGLSRDARKGLILEHLRKHTDGNMEEFSQLFPDLPKSHISRMLKELKNENMILSRGSRRWARWCLKDA